MKKRISLLFGLLLTFSFVLCGCGGSGTARVATLPSETKPSASTQISTTTAPTTPPTEATTQAPVTVNIVSIGDMLMHASACNPALKPDGSFNFDYLFEHVKNEISSADLAIVNQETIFGGNEKGNISYPNFNTRTELGDSLVNAGFDIVLHASNHTLDQDINGVLNTLNYWKSSHPDTTVLGIHSNTEEASNINIVEKNGIKFAVLNYTYGLNGRSLPAGYDYLVDLMDEKSIPKIADDIKRARSMADFVIVFPHWGEEYLLAATQGQKDWAKFFADCGADLIIGTHTHVIGPVEWITSSDGRQVLCYYSLGNFVSIQYRYASMLGGMAKVSVTKDATGTHISKDDMDFVVTHYTPGRTAVTTYMLRDYTNELAQQHAILTEPDPAVFTEKNAGYTFTPEGLKAIAMKVCPAYAK